MIRFRIADPSLTPAYMSRCSAGADLRAREAMEILPGKSAAVPTGVWIENVDWDKVPAGLIPEIQIRARSGLAFKHQITLMNGVGTVDADYPEEIKVLLWNAGSAPFCIAAGERIAQLVIALVAQAPTLKHLGDERLSGFGSTGKK